MPDTFKEMQETFEIFVNQQGAELEAVRAILQGFVVSILSTREQGPALFVGFRDETLNRLEQETKHAGGNQDATEKAEFVLLRATQFFALCRITGLSS